MLKKKKKSKKKKSKKIEKILIFIVYVLGLICFLLGVSFTISLICKDDKVVVSNDNLNKSVTDEVFVSSYKNLNKKYLQPVMYSSMSAAVSNSENYPTSFVGKLTHYGPDCAGCGGHLGCNGQDARNGNIYYNDKEYGTIRVVAASKILPCGSIIRINVDKYDPNGMYAIVLDRGVSEGIIDLLKVSEKAKSPVRTVNNVKFDIVRYGY